MQYKYITAVFQRLYFYCILYCILYHTYALNIIVSVVGKMECGYKGMCPP